MIAPTTTNTPQRLQRNLLRASGDQTSVAQVAPAESRPALSISNLTKSYGGQVVLDDLSVGLQQGEIVLLRGDNGAGKTTLINILTGNLEPDAGEIDIAVDQSTESFRFPRKWWSSLNPFQHFTPERLAKAGVARMWQDVRLLPSLDLSDNVAVASPEQIGENPLWAFLKPNAWRRQERSISQATQLVLADLGIAELSNKSPDELSLGQSKRVAIARAVQSGARILFLDEPLSGLDARGMHEVLSLLESLSSSGKITIVIIEHIFNISHIMKIATKVWTLREGKIFTERPEDVRRERSCDTDFQHIIDRLAGDAGAVVNLPLVNGATLTQVAPAHVQDLDIIFEVQDLVVHRGRRLVIGEIADDGIRGLSFKIARGQIAILHAPNGWGKTTLLEAIAGLLPVSSGKILVNNRPVDKMRPWQRSSAGLSLLRARDNFFATLTVKESLEIANNSDTESLSCFHKKRVSDLSGGERQRVLTNSVLGNRHLTIGLLDEPFSALDPKRVEELTETIMAKLDLAGILIAIPSTVTGS